MGGAGRGAPQALLPIDVCRTQGAHEATIHLGRFFRRAGSRRSNPTCVRWNMDWKSRIRAAVNAQGHTVSEDIVEELAAHAAAFYQSRINDGCASADAEQDTQALIISLCEK